MTDPDREPAGDYGYDEAHADLTGGRSASPPIDAEREHSHTAGARGTSDGDDYGYDEAHAF